MSNNSKGNSSLIAEMQEALQQSRAASGLKTTPQVSGKTGTSTAQSTLISKMQNDLQRSKELSRSPYQQALDSAADEAADEVSSTGTAETKPESTLPAEATEVKPEEDSGLVTTTEGLHTGTQLTADETPAQKTKGTAETAATPEPTETPKLTTTPEPEESTIVYTDPEGVKHTGGKTYNITTGPVDTPDAAEVKPSNGAQYYDEGYGPGETRTEAAKDGITTESTGKAAAATGEKKQSIWQTLLDAVTNTDTTGDAVTETGALTQEQQDETLWELAGKQGDTENFWKSSWGKEAEQALKDSGYNTLDMIKDLLLNEGDAYNNIVEPYRQKYREQVQAETEQSLRESADAEYTNWMATEGITDESIKADAETAWAEQLEEQGINDESLQKLAEAEFEKAVEDMGYSKADFSAADWQSMQKDYVSSFVDYANEQYASQKTEFIDAYVTDVKQQYEDQRKTFVDEYVAGNADYIALQVAAKSDVEIGSNGYGHLKNFGNLMLGILEDGAGQNVSAVSEFTNTVNNIQWMVNGGLLLDEFSKYVTQKVYDGKENPVQKFDAFVKNIFNNQTANDYIQEKYKDELQYNSARAEAQGNAAATVNKYGTTVAAMAMMVVMSEFEAINAVGNMSPSALQAMSYIEEQAPGMAQMLSTISYDMQNMMGNSTWYSSFITEMGNAKADADETMPEASEAEKTFYAMVYGWWSATVEVGGVGELNDLSKYPAWLRQLAQSEDAMGAIGKRVLTDKEKKAIAQQILKNTFLGEPQEEIIQGLLQTGLSTMYGNSVQTLLDEETSNSLQAFNSAHGWDALNQGVQWFTADQNAEGLINLKNAWEDYKGAAVGSAVMSGGETAFNRGQVNLAYKAQDRLNNQLEELKKSGKIQSTGLQIEDGEEFSIPNGVEYLDELNDRTIADLASGRAQSSEVTQEQAQEEYARRLQAQAEAQTAQATQETGLQTGEGLETAAAENAANAGTNAENAGTDAESAGTNAENAGTNAANAGTNAENAAAPEQQLTALEQILSTGTVTNKQTQQILNDPEMRAEFEKKYGKLPATYSEQKKAIRAAAQAQVQQQTTTPEQQNTQPTAQETVQSGLQTSEGLTTEEAPEQTLSSKPAAAQETEATPVTETAQGTEAQQQTVAEQNTQPAAQVNAQSGLQTETGLETAEATQTAENASVTPVTTANTQTEAGTTAENSTATPVTTNAPKADNKYTRAAAEVQSMPEETQTYLKNTYSESQSVLSQLQEGDLLCTTDGKVIAVVTEVTPDGITIESTQDSIDSKIHEVIPNGTFGADSRVASYIDVGATFIDGETGINIEGVNSNDITGENQQPAGSQRRTLYDRYRGRGGRLFQRSGIEVPQTTTERGQRLNQRQIANQRNETLSRYGVAPVSARVLVSEAAETSTVRVVPRGLWDNEQIATDNMIYQLTGKHIIYFNGMIELKDGNGAQITGRNRKGDNRILVRADMLTRGARNIALHEALHAIMDNEEGSGLRQKLREAVENSMSRAELQKMREKYNAKYGAVYRARFQNCVERGEMTPEEAEQAVTQKVEEEIFADALGEINRYSAHAERLHDVVANVLKGEKILTDEMLQEQMPASQMAETPQETRGPPAQATAAAEQNTPNAEQNTAETEQGSDELSKTEDATHADVKAGRPVSIAGEVHYSLSENPTIMERAAQWMRDKVWGKEITEITPQIINRARMAMNRVASFMQEHAEELGLPDDISGNTLFGNQSYGRSEENTTVCIRSLINDRIQQIAEERLGRKLSINESIYLTMASKEFLDEPQCAYCYVAADRMAFDDALGNFLKERDIIFQAAAEGLTEEQAAKRLAGKRKLTDNILERAGLWYNMYFDPESQKTMLQQSDLAGVTFSDESVEEGRNRFANEDKTEYDLAIAYARSASHAKKRVGYTAYDGNLLDETVLPESLVKTLNEEFGLRMYSYSDYSPAFILENMQMVMHSAVRGLKMLAYTKELDFVRIFAKTGMNINISVFGFRGPDGTLLCDGMMGADWNQAQQLRQQYPNVGITFVCVDDRTVNEIMDNADGKYDWVDVILPYHSVFSGGTKIGRALGYTDYKSIQGDAKTAMRKKAEKTVHEQESAMKHVQELQAKGEDVPADLLKKANQEISDDMRKLAAAGKEVYPTAHDNDLIKYMDALKAQGLEPRFKAWLKGYDQYKAGKLTEQEFRAMNPNYMKLVNETRRSASETPAVKPIFDDNAAMDSLQDLINKGGYNAIAKNDEFMQEQAWKIADQIAAGQAKSVNTEKPTKKPGKEAGKSSFSLDEPEEEVGDLIAVHSLNPEDMTEVLRMGGMPAPSIAVINGKVRIPDFGTVTALFGAETINPESNESNKIYGADAWTPTRGNTSQGREINNPEAVNTLQQRVSDIIGNKYDYLDTEPMDSFHVIKEPFDAWNVTEAIRNGETLREAVGNEPAVKAAYLESIGEPVEPEYTRYGGVDVEKTVWKMYAKAYETDAGYQQFVDQLLEGMTDDDFRYSNYVYNGEEKVKATPETIAQAMRNAGERGIEAPFSAEGLKSMTAPEFSSLDEVHMFERKLSNNRYDSGMGDRLVDQTSGEIAADIRKNGNVTYTNDEEDVEYLDGDWSDDADDSATDLIFEAARRYNYWGSKEENLTTVKALAEEMLGENVLEDESAEHLVQILNITAEMNADYFEAKPYRGVGVNEIKAVILPNRSENGFNMQELKRQLKAAGIPVYEYRNGEMEQRRNAVNQAADDLHTKFSLDEADEEYMAAVDSGDVETQQRLVDQAAENAGYNIVSYHGTGTAFTVFDTTRGNNGGGQYGAGAYFTPSEYYAGEYAMARAGNRGTVNKYYLRLKNLFDDRGEIPDAQWAILEPILRDQYGFKKWELKPCKNWGFSMISKTLNEKLGLKKDNSSGWFDLNDAMNNLLRSIGFDGIVGEYNDSIQYVVFSPENIKSADPVTYDDAGNVIPLSERFNPESNDIRYSLDDDQMTMEEWMASDDLSAADQQEDEEQNLEDWLQDLAKERGINPELNKGQAPFYGTNGQQTRFRSTYRVMDDNQLTNAITNYLQVNGPMLKDYAVPDTETVRDMVNEYKTFELTENGDRGRGLLDVIKEIEEVRDAGGDDEEANQLIYRILTKAGPKLQTLIAGNKYADAYDDNFVEWLEDNNLRRDWKNTQVHYFIPAGQLSDLKRVFNMEHIDDWHEDGGVHSVGNTFADDANVIQLMSLADDLGYAGTNLNGLRPSTYRPTMWEDTQSGLTVTNEDLRTMYQPEDMPMFSMEDGAEAEGSGVPRIWPVQITFALDRKTPLFGLNLSLKDDKTKANTFNYEVKKGGKVLESGTVEGYQKSLEAIAAAVQKYGVLNETEQEAAKKVKEAEEKGVLLTYDDAYLQAAAERNKRMDEADLLDNGKTEFTGTAAMQKLGIKIAGSMGRYEMVKQMMDADAAAKKVKRAAEKAEKRLSATAAEKNYALGIANGIYSGEDIPGSMRADVVEELADYYYALTSINADLVKNQRRAIMAQIGRNINKMMDKVQLIKQKGAFSFQTNTPKRNMRTAFGREIGDKIYNRIFKPVYQNEAERFRWVNKMYDVVRAFEDSNGKKRGLTKKESALVQRLIEGRAAADAVAADQMSAGIIGIAAQIRRSEINSDIDWQADAKEMGLSPKQIDMAKKYAEWTKVQDELEKSDKKIVQVAVDAYTQQFNLFYEAINDFLVAHGYEPIGFIKGYAPHLQPDEEQNNLMAALNALNLGDATSTLPTEIAGMTASFKPMKKFNPYFLSRNAKDAKAQVDIVAGYESYVQYMSQVLYHTDDIMRARSLVNWMRAEYSTGQNGEMIRNLEDLKSKSNDDIIDGLRRLKLLDEHELLAGEQAKDRLYMELDHLYDNIRKSSEDSDMVVWLDNYANILAGKQSAADRSQETWLSRKSLNWANKLVVRFSMAQVGGKISSALNQTAQLPMIYAELGNKVFAQAAWDLATGQTRKMSWAEESDFLTGKKGVDFIQHDTKDMVVNALFIPAEFMDSTLSTLAVRGAYIKAINKGMSHEAAMSYADEFGSDIMGNRMRGVKPTLFESKNFVLRMLTVFQIEAVNTWEHVKKDLPNDFKQIEETQGKKAACKALAGVLLRCLFASFFLNRLDDELYAGSPAPFDLIGLSANFIASGQGMTTNKWLETMIDNAVEKMAGERIFGTEDSSALHDGKFDLASAVEDTAYNIGNDIPLIRNAMNLFGVGDGSLPVAGLNKLGDLKDDAMALLDGIDEGELSDLGSDAFDFGAQFVPGFGQLNKTVKGAKVIASGGNTAVKYDMTPAKIAQLLLFGPSGTQEYQEYYAAGGGTASKLNETQQQIYDTLTASGMGNTASYDMIMDIYEKADELRELYGAEKITQSIIEEVLAAETELTDEQKGIIWAGGGKSLSEPQQRIYDELAESGMGDAAGYAKIMDIYTQAKALKTEYGASSITQDIAKEVLDADTELTTEQKAIIWQSMNKSWKPAGNPYSVSVGQRIYDAAHGTETTEEDGDGSLSLPTA